VLTAREKTNAFYIEVMNLARSKGQGVLDLTMRKLCKEDLWFLLTVVMRRDEMNTRPEINPEWLYERTREVEADPDGFLDLWMREGYKSTIITFALTTQDILNDPEVTFGIFSVKRELAQDFLKQIKQELENNATLKRLFPDILYQDPERESGCWGIDKGIRVKRKANSREETVEAWGLINGMPTGKHYKKLVYDDVVTEKSVTNHEQLTKTFAALRLSFALGSHGGTRRMIGTYYHFNDAWRSVVKAGIAKERMYPATDDGTVTGKSVFLTEEALAQKRKDMGSYIFACQMLLDPKADQAQGFQSKDIRAWTPKSEFWDHMNICIICDPAGEKKIKATGSDYTVFWVIGLGEDGRYYLIDGTRDRLNLAERTKKLFEFVRKYKPDAVGYEQYGMQADIAHIKLEQDRLNFHFEIVELGGAMPKNDRIRKLIPYFESHEIFTPGVLTIRDREGAYRDIIQEFVDEEFLAFPVSSHDDMLDCLARVLDPALGITFPDPDEYIHTRGGYPNTGAGANMSNGVDIDPLENA